jgi:hypothetical protein
MSTLTIWVRAHGEAGWTGRLVPLTVDGQIYAGSMVVLHSARPERHRGVEVAPEMWPTLATAMATARPPATGTARDP